PIFEYTALKRFREFDQKLAAGGVTMWISALNRDTLAAVQRAPLGKKMRGERMFFNLEQAVEAYLDEQ
ncbi:MAG: hypothetical protein JSV68_05915, partial [Anaerolineaceae bacterium]